LVGELSLLSEKKSGLGDGSMGITGTSRVTLDQIFWGVKCRQSREVGGLGTPPSRDVEELGMILKIRLRR
jgi:hypothetical protein